MDNNTDKFSTLFGLLIGFMEGILTFADVSVRTILLTVIGGTTGFFVTRFWKWFTNRNQEQARDN